MVPTPGTPDPAAPSPATTKLPQQPSARQGEQLLSSGGSTETMSAFMIMVVNDVDRYWTTVLQGAGYPAPFVRYIFPMPGESVQTPCHTDGTPTNDTDAFYCPIDDTILFSQAMAALVWKGEAKPTSNTDPATGNPSGDFSVALAMAHEYAHNVQTELGIIPPPPEALRYPVYKTELHADCWAGVWANSAYYEGILEAGDIEEGIQATMLLGDYSTNPDGHHGTPMQRHYAFMAGYNSGVPSSCDPWLLDAY